MTTPAPDADWLDHANGWAFGQLEAALTWSVDRLTAIGSALGNFVQHHWMLLAIVMAAALLFRRSFEWRAVAGYTARTRVAAVRKEHAERRRRLIEAREKAWFARADDDDFEARIRALKRKLKKHEELRDLLQEASFAAGGLRFDALRRGARRHERKAEKVKAEITRLERLWEPQQVRNLVDRLMNGSEEVARKALGKLNTMWRTIDWRALVPLDELNAADQKRVIQLLEVMASNAQLHEARNAFAFVEKILDSYQRRWGEAA